MNNIKIGGDDFVYITALNPERDESGRIIEVNPAPQPTNSKGYSKHKYGNGPFCKFRIPGQNPELGALDILGVYALIDEMGNILYIGECSGIKSSTLIKRFNNGYGQISAYKCYSNGQSTNCRVNNNILTFSNEGHSVLLFFHETSDPSSAIALEVALLNTIPTPPWNIQIPSLSYRVDTVLNTSIKTTKPKRRIRSSRANIKDAVIEMAEYYIDQARKDGKKEVTITAREIHNQLKPKPHSSRHKAVCNALQDKRGVLQQRANIESPIIVGKNPSSTTKFIYRLL